MKKTMFSIETNVAGEVLPIRVYAHEMRREYSFEISGVRYIGRILNLDGENTFQVFFGGLEITQEPLGQTLTTWMRAEDENGR